jgi:tetratricopeptide (TPR) repeat protein
VKRLSILFIVLAALIILSPGSLPLFSQTAGRDEAARDQADAFLAQADLAMASGSGAQALALLSSALELSPDYSEALYRRARVEREDRGLTLAAIADVRMALKQGTWKSTDPSAAEQLLAEILLRGGKPAEARMLLERLRTVHPEDSQNALLLARSFAKSRDPVREQRVLSDAAVRFPLVDDFRLLSAALLDGQGRRAEARNVIAVGLKVHPDSAPLLLAAARLERDARARIAAVDLYVGKGGTDPLGAVLALEASTRDRQKYLDLFLAQGGLGYQDLVNRVTVAVRGSKDLGRSLQSALSVFTGPRDLDGDGDGIWEDQWVFDKGIVTDWAREPAQDGVAQFSAQFAQGEPSSFTYAPRSGVTVTLKYSRYPFVESAALTPGGTLFLVPYTVQCVFLQTAVRGELAGAAPRPSGRIQTPTLEQLRKAAYRSEEYARDGVTLVRRSELSRGQKVYVEEDTDGDGRLDHRLWFVDGLPARGERSLTGDGIFPIKETWRAGKLVGEAVGADTHERYRAPSRVPFGAAYSGQGGTVVRNFAAAFDGQDVTHPEVAK